MVAENGRWVIDDVVSSHGSVWQAVNGENEKILTVLASLQKEQPEAFVDELFEHIADYSWPWTWVVSDTYRQAVNAFIRRPSGMAVIPMKICRQSDNLFTITRSALVRKRYFPTLMKFVLWRKLPTLPVFIFVFR